MSLTVLHLAANRWWTGSADPVIQLASGLRARGHRVLLGVIPGDRFEAKAREAGFDLVPGLDLQARFQPFAFMRDVRRLSKVVAREGVDVIHCHHSHDHWLGMLIRDARDDRLVPVVSAFRLLRAKFPDARLLLVGKGETRPRLEALVADMALSDHVVFTGYRDRDLPAMLAAADCFVLMAAGSDESCRAALEAMAAARPVVARAVGALPDTVVHGETGLLVEDDRPESVMAALAAILADPARARAMGLAGPRRARPEFVPGRAVAMVEQVYRSLP